MVFVTDKPTFSNQYSNYSSNNTALLFLNVRVLTVLQNVTTGSLIDYTRFMCKNLLYKLLIYKSFLKFFIDFLVVEETVPIDFKIGFVKSSNSNIKYGLDNCELVTKLMIYRDTQLCELFKIDENTGLDLEIFKL